MGRILHYYYIIFYHINILYIVIYIYFYKFKLFHFHNIHIFNNIKTKKKSIKNNIKYLYTHKIKSKNKTIHIK